MYPHSAGKIASNGPYKQVKDIYKIEGLTGKYIISIKFKIDHELQKAFSQFYSTSNRFT